MIFEIQGTKAKRFDIEVNGIMFAADISKKYRNGRYVNVRLAPDGNGWHTRHDMFTNDPKHPLTHSSKNVAKFFIENNGVVRSCIVEKERFRNRSDKEALEANWRPYADALFTRMGLTL
jgi:hypothetical protein|tara:strand:- start:309 stop:665 length:357 start_codon:yes stop_codon:yes gene_type:complete